MHTKIRWGIIGLGQIAHKFASDIQLSSSAILQGVASRDIDKARSFSKNTTQRLSMVPTKPWQRPRILM